MDKPHKKLNAWSKSMELVQLVYEATRAFPATERYGLTGQIRRAAVSIVANLAEGSARRNPREYLHFIQIAAGSASELDTLLEVSNRTGLLDHNTWRKLDARLVEVDRLLFGLRRYLRRLLPTKK
jgi:four helix bundle protein